MSHKMLFGYRFGKLSVAIVPSSQSTTVKDDWQDIDPASLPNECQGLYNEYKALYRQAAAARKAFELSVQAVAGLTPVYKPEPKSAKRMSLADYLALNS